MIFGNGQDSGLNRRKPHGKRPAVVLEQHAEKPFHRAEESPMDHHRARARTVRSHEFQVEPLREVEVQLQGGKLPASADGVCHMHIYLRAVESAAALFHFVFQARCLHGRAQAFGGCFPEAVVADGLAGRLGGQAGAEIVEPESPQHRQHELQKLCQLACYLLGRAEDVAVVLGESSGAEQAVKRARKLVAIYRAQLEQAQRQLPIRAQAALVDHHMERAVHRLGVVARAFQFHLRIHAFCEEIQVAARLPQVGFCQMRAVDQLVVGFSVPLAAVFLHDRAHHSPPGMPHCQARAEFVRP